MEQPKLIRNWKELAQVPDSPSHTLEIGEYNGWVKAKDPDSDKFSDRMSYLSTHTFYGHKHEYSTHLLQKCGFNIIIDNWDKKDK